MRVAGFSRSALEAQAEARQALAEASPESEPAPVADFSEALARQSRAYEREAPPPATAVRETAGTGRDTTESAPEPSSTLADAIRLTRHVHSIASARLLSLIALLGMLGMFGYCVAEPTVPRIVASGLFAAAVFWPAVLVDMRGR